MVSKKRICDISKIMRKLFKQKLGNTIEIYIDDMVVKSKNLQDLEKSIQYLGQVQCEVQPFQVSLGVKAGMFLGYMVTKSD